MSFANAVVQASVGSKGAIEQTVFIIGLMLGILFGFDGWKSSLKVKFFKDTYRVVGLQFIAVGAGISFLGDLKTLNSGVDVDRWSTLFSYAFGVILGVGGVVVLVGGSFLASSLWKLAYDRENHPDLPPNAGIFYLQNGFEETRIAWAESVERKKQVAQSEMAAKLTAFHSRYVEGVGKALASTERLRGSPSENERRNTQEWILAWIVDILSRYCHLEGRGKEARFQANYMRLFNRAELPEGFEERVQFAPADISSYNRFLRLEKQTGQTIPAGFIIPVEKDRTPSAENRSLPGAPKTVLTGEVVTFADIERDMKFGTGLKEPLKAKIKAHFENRGVKGLICLPVLASSEENVIVLGVANVECTEADVLCRLSGDRLILTDLLLPFLGLLARTQET